MFHDTCALVQSELLISVSIILPELRKNENSYFMNSSLDTWHTFHSVSVNFFVNAFVIVEVFDLLQPVCLYFIYIFMLDVTYLTIEEHKQYTHE